MKQFTGSKIYRGVQVGIIVTAKSIKEAADMLEVTPYEIKTYYGVGLVSKENKPLFEEYPNEIWAFPMGGILGNKKSITTFKAIKTRIDFIIDKNGKGVL